MLYVTIEHDSGDKSMVIHAKNMHELIHKTLPKEAPRLADDLPLLQQTKRFKRDPEGEEQKERDSGWYYDC